jgi:hypothetical protein
VNLDKRVRSDHPVRRINQALDSDFIRREVAKLYNTKGRDLPPSRDQPSKAVGAPIEAGGEDVDCLCKSARAERTPGVDFS